MTSRVAVQPDPARGPGHAVIRVEGAGVGDGTCRFRLTRAHFDASILGPNGWQVSDVLLQPDEVILQDGAVMLCVGPTVCEAVMAGSIEFSLPSAGLVEPVFWPEIVPQHAGVRPGLRPPAKAAAEVAAGELPADAPLADLADAFSTDGIVSAQDHSATASRWWQSPARLSLGLLLLIASYGIWCWIR